MPDDYNIFSSGGVGDALIVGLKIQKMRSQNGNHRYVWEHREKHSCHAKACNDIMDCFAEDAKFILSDNPEREAMEAKSGSTGYYIDTTVNWVPDPYLKFRLGSTFFMRNQVTWPDQLENPIVIQMAAGRMHDGTKRIVSIDVIKQIREWLPKKSVLLLGPEPINVDIDGICNFTGQTSENIRHAFSCIDDCSMFIGQDGVLSYYAMMQKKPTIVAYHIHTLTGHYWNNAWANHSVAILGAHNNLSALPNSDKVQSLIDMIKHI